MAEFKLVIGDPKTGKSYQREVKDQEAAFFIGKKIKDNVKGEVIGLQGYEFEITGGSDSSGFPMRYDVDGTNRKRILAVEGVGLKKKGRGIRQRKTVCGNRINDNITQINLKILKHGKEQLDVQAEPEKEEKPAEEKSEPKEEKKEEVKEEPKPEEKKEETNETDEEEKKDKEDAEGEKK